jgi:hypothetical protein
MSPRYRVTLTEQEREELEMLTKRGKIHTRRFIHARALLLCDAGPKGPAWNVADTAAALGVTSRTIEHLKKRFVEEGIEAAIERKPREKPPREVIFDGAFEARLISRPKVLLDDITLPGNLFVSLFLIFRKLSRCRILSHNPIFYVI